MSSDSDADVELISRKPKRPKTDSRNDIQHKEGKKWEHKKLKKLRRQQKLLSDIDRKKLKSTDDEDNDEDKSESVEKAENTLPEENSKPVGRAYTVSIAVAGSIIDNAQSPPLKAYLAGQVARAAAIFRVDEVIVYDDTGGLGKAGCEQMARILQFLECPQYLRKDLFPIHPDLQYAGLIAPLDSPHHLRKHEALPFR